MYNISNLFVFENYEKQHNRYFSPAFEIIKSLKITYNYYYRYNHKS